MTRQANMPRGMSTSSPAPPADLADRLPPHDLEAEMSLLGSMVLDSAVIAEVIQIVKADEAGKFYRQAHGELFTTLVAMYQAKQAVDLTTLRDELKRRGTHEQIGGDSYLIQIAESVPSPANAPYYARIVRDKALLRDLIRCAGETMQEAFAEQQPAAEILDEAERRLFGVTEQRILNQPERIRDMVVATMEQLRDRDGHSITGVRTGFHELDDLTSGLQRGEMVIIAARPSMGKTAIGLNIADNVGGVDGQPVAFFSLEMSKQQVAQRLLCGRSGTDSHRMRMGRLREEELQHLMLVAGDMREAPIFVDDTPSMTPTELLAKCRRLRLQHSIELAVVDYLQLMHIPRPESRQQEIATISRYLKAMARELNIPVVALAQLNRSPEGREGHRPRMSDLRESGAIEQDADVVMLLHREEYYKQGPDGPPPEVRGTAELIVAKQRNGPTGTIQLHWDARSTRFTNLSVAPEPSGPVVPDDFGDEPPF